MRTISQSAGGAKAGNAQALVIMEYLLTWNCTHIANAVLRPRIEAVCRLYGYEPPIICTPQELMEV